jgi:alpha,alpha-trehalase
VKGLIATQSQSHAPPAACVAALLAAVLGAFAASAAPDGTSPPPSPSLSATAYPEPPQALFQELFLAVQTERLYADGKTFADAIPNSPPEQILRSYRDGRPASSEALKRFVEAHFTLPVAVTAPTSSPERVALDEHIDRLWGSLTRRTMTTPPFSSLLPLPRPYVVPGGRFREIYYWDSYFTMLGLVESRRLDLVEDMVADFAYFIGAYGHVPNGARTYYLSRSQPPFFFEMVGLLDPHDPAAAYARFLPQLKAEYAFWMQGADSLRPGTAYRHVVALADGSVLNRFWDDRDTPRDESFGEDMEWARTSEREPRELFRDIRAAAESGWDFSSRWFADGRSRAALETTAIVPIDLNALLFGLENAIRAGCERAALRDCATEFARRGVLRRAAIDHYLWDAHSGAYLDYRWTRRERIPRVSAATMYPLFVEMASASQAASVARVVARELLKPGGIVTTPVETGQQWDAPNGWAPLQWISVEGFRHYAQGPLAEMIACRWMSGVYDVYRRTGKLVEKYDVLTPGQSGGGGEYPSQDGFGWTNGVMRKLMVIYPQASARASAGECMKDGALRLTRRLSTLRGR